MNACCEFIVLSNQCGSCIIVHYGLKISHCLNIKGASSEIFWKINLRYKLADMVTFPTNVSSKEEKICISPKILFVSN